MSDTHKRRTVFFQLRSLLGIVLLVLLAYHSAEVPRALWVLGIALLVSDLLVLLLPLSWLEDPKLPYAVFLVDSGVLTLILYGISGYESDTLLLYYLTLFMATLGQDVRKSIGIAVVASLLEVGLRMREAGSVIHDPDTLSHIPLFFVTAVLCSYLAENARASSQRASQLKETQRGLVRELAHYADDLNESEQLRAKAQLLAHRLRESEERLRLFVEHAPAAIAMLDRDMKYVAASRRWLADYHLGDQEIVGRSHYDLFSNLPEHWKEIHRRCLAGAVEKSDEDLFLLPDGTTEWLRREIRPWNEPSGEIGGILIFSEVITERKQAEQALRRSEARYRRFLEGNAAGVLRTTLDGRILDCNSSLARILGYASTEELKRHRSPELYFYPELRDLMLKHVKNDKVLIGKEARLKRKDGSPVWVFFNVSLIQGDGDTGDVLEGTIIDITERKRAEEELRKSEASLARAQQIAHLGNWVHDLTTDELYWSDECYRIFGETREKFRPSFEGFLNHVHPDDREIVKKASAEAFNERKPYSVDHRIVRPGGTEGVVHEEAEVTWDDTGKPILMLGTVHDITERKRTEAESRRQVMAIEQSADGIVVTDSEGSIQYVNPAFTAMTQYTRDEALGQNPRLLKSGAHGTAFYKNLWDTIKAGNVWHDEIINRRKDGGLYTEAMTIAAVRDSRGVITNYIAVKQDVTERKQLEQQFRQSQKMEAVGKLAGGVAHDFNNLLTVINGYSEFMLDGMEPDDPNRNYAGEIKKAGERAAALTRQLLAFSRKQVLEPHVLDLNAVIADMDKMLRRLIGEDIDLVTVAGKELGRVKADPGQIEQVIVNLAVNSRDAMPHGGKLTLETRNADLDETYVRNHVAVKPGPHVMLAISDTGAGMDAETQKRIFEPFFTTKEKGKGTGLGLSTVYGIIKQSDGSIWVYSEPGHGTTFKIYLPRVDEPLAAVSGRAGVRVTSGSETVLLAEDESALRQMVLEILELKGYHVLEADTGAAALLVSEEYQGPIHLLITDVVMPEMGGRGLFDRLVISRPEMKVLYMSGYTDNAIVHGGVLEAGMNFLQKPFTPEVLARKVRDVLDSNKEV